jgi:hypothetical protein
MEFERKRVINTHEKSESAEVLKIHILGHGVGVESSAHKVFSLDNPEYEATMATWGFLYECGWCS